MLSLEQGSQTRGPQFHFIRSYHCSYSNYRFSPGSVPKNIFYLKYFRDGPEG
jgi:hypothetical protein